MANAWQLFADLCRRVALVSSQLLEHNLTDTESICDNAEQLIYVKLDPSRLQ
jgi:hypothetical protein